MRLRRPRVGDAGRRACWRCCWLWQSASPSSPCVIASHRSAPMATPVSSSSVCSPAPPSSSRRLVWPLSLPSAVHSNPVLVGLAAGLGEALGELVGYLAGYSGSAVIEDRARYAQLERLERRYGVWVIFILSVIPNPFFDLAGIAAGMLKFSVLRFFIACWLGKTIKTILVALAGAGAWGAVTQWLR
ncbi:VTT domain-containing protein [Candidatus Amarolinea dominans]|uniref:VTT domain-containing protein n=1 Tax=Candidatus Amarolinea dominans TaxID=3140696 RepID=UPI0031CC6EF7